MSGRSGAGRLPAIDVVRGLAVVLMVMHHVVDAWLRPEDRIGPLFMGLRHLGGLPAPAFMVLAGVSSALVLARERERGVAASGRVGAAVRRGLYVLGIAFAFRLFAFVAGGNPVSAWRAIFRVDVLNCLGAGLALVGAFVAPARTGRGAATIATISGLAILLVAPFVWGRSIPFPSELAGLYLAGTGKLVLFPLVPWAGLIALGFAVGELLAAIVRRDPSEAAVHRATRSWPLVGAGLFFGGWALAHAPFSLYPPHDWWKASPIFAAMRFGVQLGLLGAAFALVPRLPAARRADNFLALLGRHSLLAYVLHLELAYGRLVGPLQKRMSLPVALAGTAALVALCWLAARIVERREEARKAAAAGRKALEPAG